MNDSKFDFWIKNGLNVLFTGKHGVGKTARIIEAFDKHKLKWKYFSASTLDPWVDFVGVPKEVKDELTGKSYLDLVRPKHFTEDDVEAIFIDEYNRSAPKIRNAVMELIQFRSINGKKFKNLKLIWAAVNPTEEEGEESSDVKYDVEEIDPAQRDRFHIHVDVPYKPDLSYFKQKFGDQNGETACIWWKGLGPKTKNKISPRRLDYAIEVYIKGGDLRDVLPKEAPLAKLLEELKFGSFEKRLRDLTNTSDDAKIKEAFASDNFYAAVIEAIVKKTDLIEKFFKYFPEEKQTILLEKNVPVRKTIAGGHYKEYQALIDQTAKHNTAFARAIKRDFGIIPGMDPNAVNKVRGAFKGLRDRSGMITAMGLCKFQQHTNWPFKQGTYKFSAGGSVKGWIWNDIADFLNNYALAVINKPRALTTERYTVYNTLAYYLNSNHAPRKNTQSNLKQDELEGILKVLNGIIARSQPNWTEREKCYHEIEGFYGYICGELLRRFSATQDYSKLTDPWLVEFLNKHASNFA